jgi:hypothetical protein
MKSAPRLGRVAVVLTHPSRLRNYFQTRITVTFEDRFGRPLTLEDVTDFIEGRREPP